jgi:hypothetical protein
MTFTQEQLDEITLHVEPFSSEVIGVDKTHVYLKERYFTKDKDSDEFNSYCVVKLQRDHFNDITQKWLDEKQDYCERYKHFCGVMGTFEMTKFSFAGEIKIYVEGDKNDDSDDMDIDNFFEMESNATFHQLETTRTLIDVPIFEVFEYDPTCDMEHG